MATVNARWTINDYHRMIEAGILEGRHVELLNGEIVEMPPEGPSHADLSSDAADYLREQIGSRAKIREGKPITLPNASEPEPDIAIVQRLDEYGQHHPYPANIFWVIEFSNSSLTKDLETKSKIYAAAGIQEYWVINLKTRELVVFQTPQNKQYQSKSILIEGSIRPLAFQDVEFSVQRLLKK